MRQSKFKKKLKRYKRIITAFSFTITVFFFYYMTVIAKYIDSSFFPIIDIILVSWVR